MALLRDHVEELFHDVRKCAKLFVGEVHFLLTEPGGLE